MVDKRGDELVKAVSSFSRKSAFSSRKKKKKKRSLDGIGPFIKRKKECPDRYFEIPV